MSRSALRWTLGALAMAASALGWPACVGTPLPDPPSLTGALVSADSSTQLGGVRVVGQPGAVHPGGTELRITIPASTRRGTRIAVAADGSFGRLLASAMIDTFYVEMILPDDDLFLGAFVMGGGGHWTGVSAGADQDGDGSPDLIDCAPTDATHRGQRCAHACGTDADCATGNSCVAGVCTARLECVAETCNAIDDDCDGTVDDGDPGGGVACTPTAGACTTGTIHCLAGVPTCGCP